MSKRTIFRSLIGVFFILLVYVGTAFAPYCPSCGYKYEGDYKFCPNCGAKLIKEESQGQQQQQQVIININNKGEFSAPEGKVTPRPLFQQTFTITSDDEVIDGEVDNVQFKVKLYLCPDWGSCEGINLDLVRKEPEEKKYLNERINFSTEYSRIIQDTYIEPLSELRVLQCYGYKYVIYFSKRVWKPDYRGYSGTIPGLYSRTVYGEFRIYPDNVMIETGY